MHPDAERINSYLDGELGPAERAAVEKLLVEDSAARELFAELRQLQSGLRELPQHTLPPGFADEVMRAAERLMLLGPGESELTPAAQEAADRPAPAPRAAVRNLWSSPAWFVSGAAAAVLLMLGLGFFRNSEEPTQVDSNPTSAIATDVETDTPREPVEEPTAPPPSVAVTPGPSPEAVNAEPTTPDEPMPPDDEPRIANDNPPSPTTPKNAAPFENSVVEPAPPPVRQRPPYGWVVWANVDMQSIREGHFDRLLVKSGITISNAVDPDVLEKGGEDVIYAEATPELLNDAFMAMYENKGVYRGTMMQYSLGVFHEPTLWSEILDAVNPVVDGSRAVHITPDVVPARPLPLEQVNAETVKQYDDIVPLEAGATDEAPRKPQVDDGLVRAVFILHPLPAGAAAAPEQADAPATTP